MKGWLRFAVVIAVVAGGMVAAHAAAPSKAAARCWTVPGSATVGQTVEIWGDGLPTRTTLNVFVTDAEGKFGWPVGVNSTGTIGGVGYTADAVGTSTIQITGPERPNNVKVYATCSMEVSV